MFKAIPGGDRSRNRIISRHTLGPRVAACHAERSDARQRSPRGRQTTTRAVSGAPVITVRRPDVSRPLRNPMTFDVQFTATPGATIDRSTFQARYGRLGINITRRLLAHATWTPGGLFAGNVNVPTGNHRISVSIADNLGRVGTRVVNLQVLR